MAGAAATALLAVDAGRFGSRMRRSEPDLPLTVRGSP